MKIPTNKQAAELEFTKYELARALYPEIPFDVTLPQQWVDQAENTHGVDVRPNFVWLYRKGDLLGKPGPLTVEAQMYLTGVRTGRLTVTHNLPMELLRREFPDYLEVGKVYHWPRVPGVKWVESSWSNNVCPTWFFEAPEHRLRVSFWADYASPSRRENNWGGYRYAVYLQTDEGDDVSPPFASDHVVDIQDKLVYLARVLGVTE